MGAVHYDARGLANRWYLLVWLICRGLRDVNFQVEGLTASKAYAIGQ